LARFSDPQMKMSHFMPRKLVDNECLLVRLAVQMAVCQHIYHLDS
jgi:hypothetical protein